MSISGYRHRETSRDGLEDAGPMNGVDFHLRFNFHEARVEADAGRRGEAGEPWGTGLFDVPSFGPPDRTSGEKLFTSIIRGQVESLYRDCLRSVRRGPEGPRSRGSLRIIIHLDPRHEAFDDYALIRSRPWEWLFDPIENKTLGLHRDFSIVRQLKTSSNSSRRVPNETVNVLLLDFSPPDLPGLDTESEADELEAIFDQTPRVHCRRLSAPTVDMLRLALLEREVHILHFAGHGDSGVIYLSEPRREVQLLEGFEASNPEEARFSHAVDGELLASCLGDQPGLQLVFLNACKTGVMLPGHGVQPLAGMAPELMAAGVPMVIAPRVDVYDDEATAFSKRFFSQLWQETTVDTAIVEGRQAIRNSGPGDWSSFSVFMRHTENVGAFNREPWPSEVETNPANRHGVEGLAPLPEVTALSGQAFQRIHALLTSSEHQQEEFFQKYVSWVYHERTVAHELFLEFLTQKKQGCFVVTGEAGKGKTNLLCHFTDVLRDLPEADVAILISANELRLHEENLGDALVHGLMGSRGRTTISAMAQHVTEQGGRLVALIDGVNELQGRDGFDLLNTQLTQLLQCSRDAGWSFWVVVSCRTEYWPSLRNDPWAQRFMFRNESESPVDASCRLKDFDVDEIDEISQRYFAWYAIEGSLQGEARRTCCDPLMLRYLCAAHTRRPPWDKSTPAKDIQIERIGTIRTMRRKQVFDEFVRNRRISMAKAARAVLDEQMKDSRAVYQLTTRYLICLAHAMYANHRSFLTMEEVVEVARALGHRDAQLADEGTVGLQYRRDSIFFQLVNEGIILNRRDKSTFSFTFESYFEYSLGRYFALELWPVIFARDGMAGVEQSFKSLMDEHTSLSEPGAFNNLYGALQFAVLVTEQGDPEENVEFGVAFLDKATRRELFLRLISCMLGVEDG